MKKILTLSFIIFSTFLPLMSWALPACPSGENVYRNNCFGTWRHESGYKYEGEWKNNKQNGQGTASFPNGDKYIGEFEDGQFHAKGTYTFADGEQYVGEHKDGKRNGYGTSTYVSGNKYVGEYKNGKRNGQGTFTFANGAKDVGEFRNGKLNGFAIRFDKNGNILKEGIWKDDEFQYVQKQSSGSSNSSSKLDKYKEFCKEVGFTPGTEKFGECVLKAMEVE